MSTDFSAFAYSCLACIGGAAVVVIFVITLFARLRDIFKIPRIDLD